MGAARKLWDAAKHPRGPDGRFIKAPSVPKTVRPSLSDAVLGTASAGPKRQRSAREQMALGRRLPAAGTSTATAKPTAPPKRTARAAFDTGRVQAVADRLRTAPTHDAARRTLDGLTIAELRQLATHLDLTLPSNLTKAKAVGKVAEIRGRVLDSAAIRRMG